MMQEKQRRPAVIIVDNVPERCLREEAALDRAIEDKGIHAIGMSNYGTGYINRTGVPEEKLPCIELERYGDVTNLYFFPPRPGEELTYEALCKFLDMLLAKGALQLKSGL